MQSIFHIENPVTYESPNSCSSFFFISLPFLLLASVSSSVCLTGLDRRRGQRAKSRFSRELWLRSSPMRLNRWDNSTRPTMISPTGSTTVSLLFFSSRSLLSSVPSNSSGNRSLSLSHAGTSLYRSAVVNRFRAGLQHSIRRLKYSIRIASAGSKARTISTKANG